MWKAKYIIHKQYIPIVFPETINHADMARNMGWKREDIIGAGFVFVVDDSYKCYGESISLRVTSCVEEDEKLLNRYLGGRQEDV